jgi:UDP-2,3-diacylglucosamine hydrolase
MTLLFVSDLHLDASRPQVTDSFCDFLAGEAREAERLYILGDLFELWIADDPQDEHQQRVVTALHDFTADGHRCLFTHGNRDFLIDAGFADRTGIEIQPSVSKLELPGGSALLLHGDELCTDDLAYQRMRRILRSPRNQAIYRALPGFAQRAIASRIRRDSRKAASQKPPTIMDVNADAVAAMMRRYDVRLMIHGHTHRPAIHDFPLDGEPARRIVLGDWYEQGSVLRWTDSRPELAVRNYA